MSLPAATAGTLTLVSFEAGRFYDPSVGPGGTPEVHVLGGPTAAVRTVRGAVYGVIADGGKNGMWKFS